MESSAVTPSLLSPLRYYCLVIHGGLTNRQMWRYKKKVIQSHCFRSNVKIRVLKLLFSFDTSLKSVSLSLSATNCKYSPCASHKVVITNYNATETELFACFSKAFFDKVILLRDIM